MNKNSAICRYIKDNPDNWIDDFKHQKIYIRKGWDDNLVLFYYSGSDFNELSDVKNEANGIIIDIDTLDVVCFPFNRIHEYSDPDAAKIDWDSANAIEKMDGIQVSMWYNHKAERWEKSTIKHIYKKDAAEDTGVFKDYKKLFESAINHEALAYPFMEEDYTYVFEMVSPEIRYEDTEIYLIGVRNNKTGKEEDSYLKTLHRLRGHADTSIIVKTLTKVDSVADSFVLLEEWEKSSAKEGIVIVDKYGNRIKVTSSRWKIFRDIESGDNTAKRGLISMLRKGELDISSAVKSYPHIAHILKYYDYKVTEINNAILTLCDVAKKSLSRDGFNVDESLEDSPLKDVAVRYARGEIQKKDLLEYYNNRYYGKLIEDYRPLDMGILFK